MNREMRLQKKFQIYDFVKLVSLDLDATLIIESENLKSIAPKL